MKRTLIHYVISAPFGVGLVFVGIGLAIAGPCYVGQWEDPPAHCNPIVGGGCGGAGGFPALGCPGTFNTTDPGININWPCGFDLVQQMVPQDYVTSGNEPTGQMSQGTGTFPCRSNRSCTKIWVPIVPLTYTCKAASVACEATTRWTAIGATCPGGGGGTGGGGGGD